MVDLSTAVSNSHRFWVGATIADWLRRHPILSLSLVAFALRLLVVAFSGLFEGFVLDDSTYHAMAADMAAGDIAHWDDFTYSLYWRTASFLAPVTGLYKLFGPSIATAQVFVAVLGACVVALGMKLSAEFLPARWVVATGLVLAFLPSQIFWSAQMMKDAPVWLALTGLGLLVAIANRSTGGRLVAAGAGIAVVLCALAFLREHTLVVAAWAVMIASLAGVSAQRLPRLGGALLLGITIPWFVAATGPAGVGLVANAGSLQQIRFQMAQGANTAIVDTTPGGTEAELNEIVFERQRIERELNAIQETDAPAEQEVREKVAKLEELKDRQEKLQQPPPGAQLTEEAGLEPNIVHLPRGLSAMLLEPFPIPFEGSASLKLARLESLLWYPLLVLAGVGLWAARSFLRPLLFPLIAGGGILVMYALSEGNIGTAHRHRGEFVWVVALLAGLGASRLADRAERKETAGGEGV